MRTSIEITNEQRAALLELAGRHGLRGYSLLIQEALEQYLRQGKSSLARSRKRKPSNASRELLAFLCDGFSTGRRDGSIGHDDYIYRTR